MTLEQLEPMIIKQGEDLASIKARLHNGLTADMAELKAGIKSLTASFQDFKDNRENTCPLKKEREDRGKGTARLMGIIFGTNSAIIAIAMLILKLAGVI